MAVSYSTQAALYISMESQYQKSLYKDPTNTLASLPPCDETIRGRGGEFTQRDSKRYPHAFQVAAPCLAKDKNTPDVPAP